jgi:transcriptional regulator with XRE-family HTH domain
MSRTGIQMVRFGDIIRKRREEKGMLLRQLAALIDMDTAILSKVERGVRRARREQVEKIAKALDLNENELMVEYLSENIAYEILDEVSAMDVLKVAEDKVKYLRKDR